MKRQGGHGWLLALAAAGLLAGGAAGVLLRRQSAAPRLGPRPARTAVVDEALRAWAEGDDAGVGRALARLRPDAVQQASDRADVAFLAAALDGDDDAMARVVQRWPDTEAAGRAAWWRVQHAPDEAERARRRAFFRARWPDAWVLGNEEPTSR